MKISNFKLSIFGISIILSLFLYFTSSIFHPIFAHLLATDKNIGAVLHIDPNDDPIANQVASFFFEFKDRQNKFEPKDCDCIFSISENGKSIFTQPLFANTTTPSLSNASIFYTFKKSDVYEITVTGKPMTGSFQPFKLVWDIRVEPGTAQQAQQTAQGQNSAPSYIIWLIVLGIIVIGFVIFIIRKLTSKGGEGKHEKKDNRNND